MLGSFAVALAVNPAKAYAACETNYGGGQTCTFNKRFDIDKDVRIEGDNEWNDKVTGVKKDEVVEFRIKIENTGEISVDNMEMKDFLPDELTKISGDLTEGWDDFEPGEEKEFKIKVVVDPKEFDKENFEKCVVNKVKVYRNKDFEGSDTATLCFGNETEIKELPKTGFDTASIMTVLGSATTGLGLFLKKLTSKVSK